MKGYRTVLVNALSSLAALALLVVEFMQTLDLAALGLSPDRTLVIVAGLGIANIVLRFATTTPVGRKG